MTTRFSRRLLATALLAAPLYACADDDTPARDSADASAETSADAGDAGDTSDGSDRAVSLRFALRDAAGNDVACDSELSLGTASTPVTLSDARFYVHAVELRSGEAWVPLELAQDETWQLDDIALLDFEDGTGACANGNALVNDTVSGTVPAGDYDGVRFVLGVPFERNHADVATAPAPLSYSAMFWNWQGGYKFVRLEGVNDGDGMRLHLGSTGCEGTAGDISGCVRENRARAEFETFDVDSDVVVFDVEALFAGADVSANTPETAPGCMSAPDDPDCPAVFEALGLDANGAPTDTQRTFVPGS